MSSGNCNRARKCACASHTFPKEKYVTIPCVCLRMFPQVRQEANGGFKVDGLTETPCSSAAAALKAFSYALQWRHTRAHAMNEYSSRSHCLMTFNFSSKEKPQEGGAQGAKGGVRRWVAEFQLGVLLTLCLHHQGSLVVHSWVLGCAPPPPFYHTHTHTHTHIHTHAHAHITYVSTPHTQYN